MSERPPSGPGERPGERPDDVGTVAEEAAKLFGALAGWAGDQGTDWGRGLAGMAGAAGGGVQDAARHAAQNLADGIDTGAPECRYCPVCRTVHLVRELSPEVRTHLTAAASSLVQAAAGILAAVEQQHQAPAAGGEPDRPTGVERIDLDGGFDDDPDDQLDDQPDDQPDDDPEERP